MTPSFHSVTFPSPQLTANTFPARLHDTRHTTSGNFPAEAAADALVAGAEAGAEGVSVEAVVVVDGSSAVLIHGEVGESLVQMRTVLSYQHEERKKMKSMTSAFARH